MARFVWFVLLLAACGVACGCASSEGRAFAQGSRPLTAFGSSLTDDAVLERVRTAPSEHFQPVGTTSLVFRMDLAGDVEAAFKPCSKADPRGALSEVAAYRVARLLGLDNVPPAILRRVPKSVLLAQLDPSHRRAVEAGVAWNGNGSAVGAAIYWIARMSNLQLERPSRMEKWTKRLRQSGWVPSRERDFYRDLSNMVAFDYLVGNWDRFTGGNAQGTADASRVFMRDHDFAFTSLVRFDRHARVFGHLRRTEKFSRSFVQALAHLDERSLRAELARDPLAGGVELLSDQQIAEVLDRREALLSYVVSLIDQYGEDKVFDFP